MAGHLPIQFSAIPTFSFSPTFFGSPNNSITAIDTSGGIALSRSSGQLPAFVQVSAQNITATGTSQPYEDLEYSWDFGDPSGTETFANPSVYPYSSSGPTVNANTDQTGPEAAYVYRTAGTKTITLKIRGQNGGSFTSNTVTATFTVSAFTAAHEWWVDSVAGSDSNNGLSSGAPFQTIDAAKSAWGAVSPAGISPSNIAIHLKRGSHFVDSVSVSGQLGFPGACPLDQIRFDAYGTGVDPIIEQTGAAGDYLAISFFSGSGGTTGGLNHTDIVVSNIQCLVSGAHGGAPADHAAGMIGQNDDPSLVVSDFYWDNCTISATTPGVQDVFALSPSSVSNTCTRAGCWNVSVTNPLSNAGYRMGMALQGWNRWLFVVGGSITGGGTGGNQDHHIYPVIENNFLVRWMNFGTSLVGGVPSRSYCINGDWANRADAFSNYNGGPADSLSGGILTIGLANNASAPFAIGMQLFDATSNAIPAGTTITSLGTGTGGAGTYHISNGTISIASFTCVGVVATVFPQYWCIDSNYMFGTQYALDLDDGFNSSLSCQWQNVVAQKNAINGLTLGCFSFYSCLTGTFRDNLAWGLGAGGPFFNPSITGPAQIPLAAACRYQVYRNKIYQTAGGTYTVSSSTPITATKPMVFTDNQIEDTRSGSGCEIINLISGEHTTSVIDRNNYLCPNATSGGTNSSPFNKDNGVLKTFTAWQALGTNFDPNSTAITASFPTWIDPANGHFT